MKLEERGRGKFKPATDLSKEQVKKILMEKINKEISLIIEDKNDEDLIEGVDIREDKFNVVGLFSGCGGLDLGFELAGLASVVGEEEAIRIFKDKTLYEKERHKSVFNTIYTN